MRNRRRFLILGGGVLMLVTAVIGAIFGLNWGEEAKEERVVPLIEISLNEVELEEIKNGGRKTKYGENSLTVDDGLARMKYEGVEIRGRGNTTWMQAKKPYRLKFEKATDLLGLGKAKKWTLLANALDAAYVRVDVAMTIAEMLEAGYVQRGRFVEVDFNGEYEGLYYLIKKVEIGKGAVDLRDRQGVLVELDNLHREEEACYRVYDENCLVLKDSVSEDEEDIAAAMEDFTEKFNRLEMAAEEGDFGTVEEAADVGSLVDYYLVSEFTVNPDAYATSFYWYKDGAEGKLHAGPVWDFDLAMANSSWVWSDNQNIFAAEEEMARRAEALGINGRMRDTNMARLFYWLMDMPEFRAEVGRVFQERLGGRKDEFLKTVKISLGSIREAAKRNDDRWGQEQFEEESAKLLEWLERRYDFMEKIYGDGAVEKWWSV